MKKVEINQATGTLADCVRDMGREILILVDDGEPVAALMPIADADLETLGLSTNPEFIAILEESRAKLKAEGGIPLEEVKRRLGLT